MYTILLIILTIMSSDMILSTYDMDKQINDYMRKWKRNNFQTWKKKWVTMSASNEN